MKLIRNYVRIVLESMDKYSYQTKRTGNWIQVTAFMNDIKVGEASAEVFGDKLFVTGDTEVHPKHRRKGIATAMYNLIEKEMGIQLHHGDIWSSPEAVQFWRSRLGDPTYGEREVNFGWNNKGEYIVYDTADGEFYNLGWAEDNPQKLPRPKGYVEPSGYDAPANEKDLAGTQWAK